MRIISGSLKGRKLVGFPARSSLRPMTDRVKESLFNMLAPHFHRDLLFLDLFSGTGNLALEALSRGAKEVHLVENHPQSLKIIKRNFELLKIQKNFTIHSENVFTYLKKSRDNPFHIIVADPPFSSDIEEKLILHVANSHLYIKGSLFVIETEKRKILKKTYSPFNLFSKKDFNDKIIWFYEAK